MMKNSNFSLLASFFGLWIISFFLESTQIIFGFILIFTFGILHGANDLLLIQHLEFSKQPFNYYKILLCYVVVVLFAAILFYLIPWLALLLFIIVSGFHFGEQHWQVLKTKHPKWILYLFQFDYGIFLLLLLFSFHSQEVKEIIFSITKINLKNVDFSITLIYSGIILILSGSYFYLKSAIFRKHIIVNIFYLIVFAVIFKTASLIWGFALYFVLWHSIPSLIDQLKFLYGEFNLATFKSYFNSAFIYWIVALISIAALNLIFHDKEIFNALFFSFLAAITFPHALVMMNMFNKK